VAEFARQARCPSASTSADPHQLNCVWIGLVKALWTWPALGMVYGTEVY